MLCTQASAVIWGVAEIIAAVIKDFLFSIVTSLFAIVGRVIRDTIYVDFARIVFFNPLRKILDYTEFARILQLNPDLMDMTGHAYPVVSGKVDFFIGLLVPFYILAFILLAVYLMVVSSSPSGRAKAKGSLVRLVLSAAIIIFTIPLIQAFMDVSLYLTKFIINISSGDMKLGLGALEGSLCNQWEIIESVTPLAFWLALPLFMLLVILSVFPIMVIGMRYFMILVFTLLFPIGVFLYSMHPTRKLGKAIVRQSILWVFIQPLMAVILVVIGVSTPLLDVVSDSAMETGFGMAGFLALSAAPLMMVGVLNWMEVMLITFAASMEAPLLTMVANIEEMEIK